MQTDLWSLSDWRSIWSKEYLTEFSKEITKGLDTYTNSGNFPDDLVNIIFDYTGTMFIGSPEGIYNVWGFATYKSQSETFKIPFKNRRYCERCNVVLRRSNSLNDHKYSKTHSLNVLRDKVYDKEFMTKKIKQDVSSAWFGKRVFDFFDVHFEFRDLGCEVKSWTQ
jgi:hypothetical protein